MVGGILVCTASACDSCGSDWYDSLWYGMAGEGGDGGPFPMIYGGPGGHGGGGGKPSGGNPVGLGLSSPQTPTWLLQTKVFLSSLGQNFVNEFTPNGCFAQFANDLAGADGSPPGAGPEDVIRSTGQAAAATYAVSQGLSYPLKSSIYRGILGGTETAAAAYTLGAFDYEVGKAFVNEMKGLAAGTCQ